MSRGTLAVQSPLSLRAALFDVEGTLVDSVPLQLESWSKVLGAAGFHFAPSDLQPYSGMDGARMLERLLPKQTVQTHKGLLKAQGELYDSEFLPKVKAFPAVRELLEMLKGEGVLVGLATTCQQDELETYESLLNVLELTDALACGEMVSEGKPDSSLIEACLAQLACPNPSLVIMIGDTPYDARAARPLGVQAAGVLTGGFSSASLREAGCAAVFSQVREVSGLWQ